MKQILQDLKSGKTMLATVPCPRPAQGQILIRSRASLVSAGTERMLLEFAQAGIINKARQQPDKVRQVVDKIRTDGLMPTWNAVRSKLDQPLPLGYCNVGIVLEAGSEGQEARGLDVGERVVSNGAHAEVVCVPRNLCARVPEGVSDEEAAFTVLAAVGLQGIRLAQPSLGETVVVIGLGLIGLLTVQILIANGCRVLGVDFGGPRLELARQFGAHSAAVDQGDPVEASLALTQGRGVDAVLITASAASSEPVHQAALMCRKRGRIVLVGVTGLELSRDDFYKKELSFQVSCSYGPGRYDPEYEQKGHDYPIGYVRWTEQRNFEAVLDLMEAGRLDVKSLITHRFPIEEADKAYEVLGGKEACLGIVLEYGKEGRGKRKEVSETIATEADAAFDRRVALVGEADRPHVPAGAPVLGFIGAGNYAGRVLIPGFKKAGGRFQSIASSGGVSAVHYGKKFGFEEATTEIRSILENEKINTVVIATRHNSHAQLVTESLQAGKHVFVEKPLCLTIAELEHIESVYSSLYSRPSPLASRLSPLVLMVGFNRRFAPQVQKMKALLVNVKDPKSFVVTVSAGQVPEDHWTQDPSIGGGRIIGEACHFVDLLRFLAGTQITSYKSTYLGNDSLRDNAILTLSFADGSSGTIHYLARGHKSFPKERIEVFCSGRVLQLDNFRKLKGFGWLGFKKMNLWRQDKGQAACAAAFVKAVQTNGPSPIPFDEILEVSRVTIELAMP